MTRVAKVNCCHAWFNKNRSLPIGGSVKLIETSLIHQFSNLILNLSLENIKMYAED